MPKRRVQESSSSAQTPNNYDDYNGKFYRTPFSNVTNVTTPDYINPTTAAENRKVRRLYLDSRKSNATKKTPNSNTNLSSSNKIPSTLKDQENITPNRYPRTSLRISDSSVNHINSLNDINTGMLVCTENNYTPTTSKGQTKDKMLSSVFSSSIMTFGNTSSANQNSCLTKLSAGKCKLISKSRNINLIPMVDLTEDSEVDKDPFRGISKEYVDHGDQNVICGICNAKLWKYEAGKGKITLGKLCYLLCCGYGRVELPEFKDSPTSYQDLFRYTDAKSKYFLKHIRRFNSMFAFTSMGGKIDASINRGNAPYIFRLGGQNYHSMGSLLPKKGEQPKFHQLYIYDTDNEVSNRHSLFSDKRNGSTITSKTLDIEVIQDLKTVLDNNNQLVKSYRMVRDSFKENPHVNLKLRLICERVEDGRTYNLPTANEVAALIVGDITDALEKRDIIVEKKDGFLKRISELHPSYLALQYPLLFPYGDDCYRIDIPHRNTEKSEKSKRQYCTMREFFAYHVQDRVQKFSLILNARRLFQQFLVDSYTMIETERLNFVRYSQKDLRCDTYENIQNHQKQGNQDISKFGQRVILPSSFTGGARYMMQNYLDAMALCKWYGYPDFFITITCNPKWPEVKRFLKDKTIKAEDRPDILCRIFKLKLDTFLKDLKEKAVLGKVQAVVYTVEFQKRGLPHAHICLFMDVDHKLPTVDHIEPFISAEIPDKKEDPELYTLVSEYMMHGPCGIANIHSPCMVDRKCTKDFPKKFSPHTCIDSKGYPVYRRRDSGQYVEKGDVQLDNRFVVPYNKYLLKRYQAHINVEWCNQAASIKYLFKYINKGPDKASVAIVQDDKQDNPDLPKDEIKEYYDCRYISACEASWRIFSYEVHYRYPAVIRLPFHLPGQQNVVYGADDDIDNVLKKNSVASSMFLGWMKLNETDPVAQKLTYVELPSKFVWKLNDRAWEKRIIGRSIGRVHSVSPALGEAYFLRILLNKVKGSKSFEDIRTYNGETFSTFRDACYARGLLDDDMEYIEAIREANLSGDGCFLRALFGAMLMSNSLSRPDYVWEETWTILSDGILHARQKKSDIRGLSLTEGQLKNLTLSEIEKYLLRNNSSLRRFSCMPYPDDESIVSAENRLINDELNYDRTDLVNEFNPLFNSLTDEQRSVFNEIMKAVDGNKGGVFFVYGYVGTGKTFLWKTLSTAIRSRGDIVLNVASSGIASLLLSGGRTAHSRFHIPINVNEDSLCHIKANSPIAHLLKETKLIIWDEAPMVHRHAVEALDRSLNDVFNYDASRDSETSFGGKVIVFGGDFRQILPVVPNGSRQQIVNASLSSSYLWNKCKVLRLTKNMRLTVGANTSDLKETATFAKWLLDIGEGKVGGDNDGETTIDIPDDLLIHPTPDPIESLIEFVYPAILENYTDPEFFRERTILAPKNEVVHEINDRLLSIFPGEEHVYLSSDSLCPSEERNEETNDDVYSPDILNGLKVSGLPNHRLVLKVGVPVMLLRNIDQQSGLCNGTRLQIKTLGKRVIEAEIISGGTIGTRTYIPRISMIPSDKKIHFKFQRRQFPICVCFAMTINKSQGQSLTRVGLYLKQPVFTHGQLYVALSRVKSRSGAKLLILDEDGEVTNKTTNVVYKEVFRHLK